MNESFYSLPPEKRQRILNAGYRVFSETSYKKAPVAEIAAQADISKALLFYYFRNKQELYLTLWHTAVQITAKSLRECHVLETDDVFEMLRRSLKAKCGLTKVYPYLAAFSLRAYYEQAPDVRTQVQEEYVRQDAASEQAVLSRLDTSQLRPGIDPAQMYRTMIWTSEGYMHRAYMSGEISPEAIECDFEQLIDHWKTVYRKENANAAI